MTVSGLELHAIPAPPAKISTRCNGLLLFGRMIEPESVILGKYRIERTLGEGGMGVVALAHHLHLDQPVAIKFLRSEVLSNHQIVQRFLREAQAAVKLKSEHVCRVQDVGTLETGSPYIVMEYLEGTDLGQWIRQVRPAPDVVVDFVLQACEALAEAHALGIVHRDIKPSNLFLTHRADGSPLIKVLDFGISKAPAAVDMDLTSTKAVMGTPAYMSPEQMRSSKLVDARTDVWALGAVLYELLSGRPPFAADTFSALCLQVAMDPTPPLDVPLPHGLREVVERCLEKDPAQRFQNVAELALALAPHAHSPAQATSTTERTSRVLGLALASAPARAATASVAAGVPTGPATTFNEQSSKSRRRIWSIAGIAGAVAAGGISILVVTGGNDSSAGEDPQTSSSAPAPEADAVSSDSHPSSVLAEPDADDRTEQADMPAEAVGGPGAETQAHHDEARDSPAASTQRADSAHENAARTTAPGSSGQAITEQATAAPAAANSRQSKASERAASKPEERAASKPEKRAGDRDRSKRRPRKGSGSMDDILGTRE